MKKVRAGNQERFQQLESAIQDKLQQAADRRLLIEAEQKEKLRNHVSFNHPTIFCLFSVVYCIRYPRCSCESV